VGQKRLEKALVTFKESHKDVPVSVTWKPYMIDPNTNINGEEFEAYNRRRWGGSGWTSQLKQEGRKDGAMFNNWMWWPNTMKSHQLVKLADEKFGVPTNKCNAALFHALYEEGKNISLLDVLVQIGKDELGIPENDVRTYLQNEEGADDVRAEIDSGRRMYGISGVPYFVINREGSSEKPYGLSGAQKTKSFVEVFEQLAGGGE